MRVEIDTSDLGFGLIQGDSGLGFWFSMDPLRVRSWAGARDFQGPRRSRKRILRKKDFQGFR